MSLADYRRNVFSQYGEDGILEHVLLSILKDCADKKCVEFGAWDGVLFSNTHNLVINHGYSGVFIEVDPERYHQLVTTYSGFRDCICLNMAVTKSNLDSILSQTSLPKDFDLLSIDIDSFDYFVWKNLSLYRPKIVVIEANTSLGPSKVKVTDNYCSPKAVELLGKEKGYELIAHTGNCILVDKQYFPLFDIEDNSLEVLFDYNHRDYSVIKRIEAILGGDYSLIVRLERKLRRSFWRFF